MNRTAALIFTTFLVAGAFAAEYKYTGGAGTAKWANDWNSATDADTGNPLWSSGAAPTSGNDYVIDKNIDWIYFKIGSNTFLGGSLTIASPDISFDSFHRNDRLNIPNLTVNAGSRLVTQTSGGYSTWPHGLWLTGTPRVDGTLTLRHKVIDGCNYFGGYLVGTLTGQGLVKLEGDTKSAPKIPGHNWRIASDNSGFKGKFVFDIVEATSGGESFATGVEILSANALGGARDAFTSDALTIESWNGLVTVGSDITLNAANCGILMKENSFFEVPASYVLTVAEPIRLTGGFFKKGAGTLALTGGFAFGADGSATADGVNSALAVKEGVLRVTQADDLKDLDVSVAHGASLELVGTTTARFRSLKAAGILRIDVDCTGLTAGSTQTITLNMPKSDAEALVGKVDVMAKGGYASIGSDLTVTESGVTVTLKVPPVTVWHDYTGSTGMKNYATWWDAQMDGDDNSKYLWSSHDVAIAADGYVVGPGFDVFMYNKLAFAGGALRVKSNRVSVEGKDQWNYTIPNLTIDVGATFQAEYRNGNATWPTWLNGDLWRIDGTLGVIALDQGYGCPTAPMIGSGLVSFGGWNWTTKARDQRLESDNSRFRGKFMVNLPKTSDGAEYAAGLRIVNANALGGALGVMTPDALTLEVNNGLIIGETLSLATENRGILMKRGAYFEVASGKSLTLAEPIRVVNGILKKGAGTLALGSAGVTLGADGAAVADGTNNKLQVKAGAIRPTGIVGTDKLTLAFDDGTSLEIDGTAEDTGLKQYGLYQPNGMTVAGAALPVKVVLAPGTDVTTTLSIPLVTVPAADAEALAAKIRGNVTVEGLVHRRGLDVSVNPVGNGLACVRLDIVRKGLILVVQ
ncbi:MAG: hypothetical protein KBT68_02095 [bacterium]|nr:hypothetical protein [Candidatus Colisoma equi]